MACVKTMGQRCTEEVTTEMACVKTMGQRAPSQAVWTTLTYIKKP